MSEEHSAKRILLIEDDFAIRNSVEFAFRRDGYEVKSLSSGDAAAQTVRDFNPDLVLLDIMLPGKSGHEICEELRQTDHRVAIIMVSALGETADRVKGLRLGADDYVSKPFSLEELLERVRANLRRSSQARSLTAGAVISEGLLFIDSARHEVKFGDKEIALRAKEFALLYALASRPGEVLTRAMLSEEVWGHDYLHSSRTIDVHIRRLRSLLSEHGAPDYVKTVHGVGYRFMADAADVANAADAGACGSTGGLGSAL